MKNLYCRDSRLINGNHTLKKYLFKCKECGQEFRLQAWRAICPNCEKSYSLIKVVEQPRIPKVRPRIFVTLLLLAYAGYSIINFSLMQDLPDIIIIIGAAIFALSGSFPSNVLSMILGGWIAYNYLLRLQANNYNIFIIILGVVIAVLGAMDELIIRKHQSKLD